MVLLGGSLFPEFLEAFAGRSPRSFQTSTQTPSPFSFGGKYAAMTE
jgi:hypothetical protein